MLKISEHSDQLLPLGVKGLESLLFQVAYFWKSNRSVATLMTNKTIPGG
jgi:hypothetical protein